MEHNRQLHESKDANIVANIPLVHMKKMNLVSCLIRSDLQSLGRLKFSTNNKHSEQTKLVGKLGPFRHDEKKLKSHAIS